LQGAVEMRRSFWMYRDKIGPSLGEGLNVPLGTVNHQMDIERKGGYGSHCAHHKGADGDVGNKLTIHHVEVNHVRTGCFSRPYLFSKTRKIGGENGRCDPDCWAHNLSLIHRMSRFDNEKPGSAPPASPKFLAVTGALR
jgi:hypothetical protein